MIIHNVITLNKLNKNINAIIKEKDNNTNQLIHKSRIRSQISSVPLKFFDESDKSYKLNTDAHKKIKGHAIDSVFGVTVSNILCISSSVFTPVLTTSTISQSLLRSISNFVLAFDNSPLISF